MKRLFLIAGVVALLLVGTVAVVSAQTPPKSTGGGCGGSGAVNGSYDYTANPVFKSVADKLGLSPADLEGKLKAGSSVAELADAKKVNLDDLVKTVSAPRIEMMQVMLKYGYVDQNQLDQMNEWMDARIKAAFEEQGYFPGWMMGPGMMGGRGGMMVGFGPTSRS